MNPLLELLGAPMSKKKLVIAPLHIAMLSLALLLLLSAPLNALSGELVVSVVDMRGKSVVDAVVYLELTDKPVVQSPAAARSKAFEIEQRGRQFLPLVSVIQTGTAVNFPNNDNVRHHVYSFSPAKVFELKLYSGVAGQAIVFDKPGTVVLGCNIHDSMVAFIHIVEAPWFAKSSLSGEARLPSLPPGNYRLKAWHYSLANQITVPEQAMVMSAGDQRTSIKLELKPFALPAGAAIISQQ